MAPGFSAAVVPERWFASLDAHEVSIVARTVAAAERLRLARIASIATRAGNGWLYPIAALLLIVTARIEDVLRFVTTAGASLAVAFLLYPLLKRSLARLRPCDYDPSLARLPEPLDHYSCPSGHAMTAAAFGVSMIAASAVLAPLALALAAVIGWSRVAMGHHYVTDVLAGAVIGSVVASSVAVIVY